MKQYHNLIENVLTEGNYKPNRTGVDTISSFSHHYSIDLQKGFPLLTTKKMNGYRWNSMLHEIFWYLSGEEHIRNLREETSIWDAWSNDQGHLETAYGRFWRRYPVPSNKSDQLPGEAWADTNCKWVQEESDGTLVFDQLQYVIDTLAGNNPDKGPNSRRLVVNAWHPANAAVSKLPPCHYTFVFNVQGNKLNVQLTQRSGDVALGIPFNIASYSLLARLIANEVGLEVGEFGHTIVDAHLYAGTGELGEWYEENLSEVQKRVNSVEDKTEYSEIKKWIQSTAPPEQNQGEDHIPNLLEQLSRESYPRPELTIAETELDLVSPEDIELHNYESHDGLDFDVAE